MRIAHRGDAYDQHLTMSTIEPSDQSLPGPLRLRSVLPVRRAGRASSTTLRALMPRAEREGRRVALVGGEAGSGKSRLVRELAREAAADGVLGAVRRLRRGRPHALPAVRRGARAARAAQRPRRAARRPRRRAAASWPGCCPTCRGGCPACPAGRGRPGHRAPPAAHRGHRPAGRRRPPAADAAGARGRPLGRRADAAPAAPPGARLRPTRGCCGRPRSATPRPTSRPSSPTTLVDLRRSEDVVRLRLGGLTAGEIAEFVRHVGRGRSGAARRWPRPSAS